MVQLLHYGFPVGQGYGWRDSLRRIAGAAPFRAPGLLARHWRVDCGELRGAYLFEDEESRSRFHTDPAVDPAFRLLAERAPVPLASCATARECSALDAIERPLFVISAPRSGSTLLYELLCRSAQLWSIGGEAEGVIEGVPTLHPAARGFDSNRLSDLDATAAARRAVVAGLLAGLRDRSGARYLDIPERARPRYVHIVEKTPENALRVGFLAAMFPDAKFVFLHRDARQTVSSMRAAWDHPGFVKYPDLPGWQRRRWHLLLPESWRSLEGAPLLDVAAFQWAAANRQALDDCEALPRDAWMTVDYAELVTMPSAVVHAICAFAGLEVDAALADALARPLPLSGTTTTPPSPLKWRSDPQFRMEAVERHRQISARLRDLGRLSVPPPPRRRPAPVRFACFVDDLPAARLPVDAQLVVDPSFYYQLGASPPLEVLRRTRHRDRFRDDGPVLWVTDASTGMTYAYWVTRSEAFRYRTLAAGRPVPRDFPDDAAARLATAGVLATHCDAERRLAGGESRLTEASHRFECSGFCLVSSVVPRAYVAALDRYYRTMVAAGGWAEGDEQVRHRHGFHNEITARYLHHQLVPLVSRVVGEPVKPTYCYVSAYEQGAVLRPHVDRRQCVFTVSLWLDGDPGGVVEPWPLWLETAAGRVSVTQGPGDAVVFLGCDLPHWRDVPASRVSTTLLFHYVPIGFAGSLD